MLKQSLIALRVTLVTLLLTGLAYPLLVTALAQVLFPGRAGGSLVRDDHGQLVGSEWIGQGFANAAYFQPRPSAAGDQGYDALASGGSNLGPSSQKLRDRLTTATLLLQARNPQAPPGPLPADLLTASASGLDPHLSPEGARWQVPRIAQARRLEPARVRQVVEDHIEGRTLGLLGEPRVNVLRLNMALDRQFGKPQ